MVDIECDFCGKVFKKFPSHVWDRNFCSKVCKDSYRTKAMNPNNYPHWDRPDLAEYNRLHNGERMTKEVRKKLRERHLNSGEGKTYTKLYGRHEHRIVAEQMLGRPLKKGEVVHHIDGNKRNNSPENLMVFSSQVEHAKWHALHKGGDSNEIHAS